jgi:uncharacterized protein involved in outer membrane biogenesis
MTMTEAAQGRQRMRSKLWLIPAALAVIVSIIVIPPLVSINRYKGRITSLMSASLRRPVRLSSVELRLFPRPGFVLTDLIVEEDPSYGVEPVLHANTVTASIRLLPLWHGHLEISRVSVDEASLNLVRTTAGRWNLDSVFRTAATPSQPGGSKQDKLPPLPYLVATNSRINIKQGSEKLPFSLLGADLSLWQEQPGDWRVRLRGQPARTDVSLDLGDTGIVQLEASLRRAPQLREMPLHLDLEWRDAQLGQLSKLILGSDPGWRGDLTGQMHLDGTADSAKVTTRLRAAGVHRAEFAPAAPLDFDANCNFVYQYSARNLENLVCDSPLGDGHLRVEGNLPGNAQPKLSLELQRIPAQAVLDALRTVRNELGAGLEAKGTLSGKLNYDPSAPPIDLKPIVQPHHRALKNQIAKEPAAARGPLLGSITVDGLRLSGSGLSQPIQVQKIVLTPSVSVPGQSEALTATINLPGGGVGPLVFTAHISLSGYQLTIHGPGSPARVRELARAGGLPDAAALDAIAGEPVNLDLSIGGPWLPAPVTSVDGSASTTVPDRLAGTVTLRNANWKSGSFPTAVLLSQATLHLDAKELRWDPVAFSYGMVKGIATLRIPAACEAPQHCPPTLDLQFATLDAAELQTTLLGEQKSGTLLSTVIARFSPSSTPEWPAFEGTVKADSLILGPITLHNAVAELHVTPDTAEFTSFGAELFNGQIDATGKLKKGDKPSYSFEGQFQKLSPPAVCQLLGLQCTGASIDGNGKVDLAGFTGEDLGLLAKGNVHFDWRQGAFSAHAASPAATLPAPLTRFDHWTADAQIANGAVTLNENQVRQGSRKSAVEAVVTFGDPPRVNFAAPKPAALSKK